MVDQPEGENHSQEWRIIHAELGRLASSKWRFIYINGEKKPKNHME
jgi:hypothetical protein